ncbi:Uncharacterised protein [Legionella feeleii]|uniref:Uncharacterized protein n=1 Tax=Legionella feeleii TaxID=453 RepID=A0A2X1QLZ9_9GAMM|nr:Uncharacterised protein [Legionella feeleii]
MLRMSLSYSRIALRVLLSVVYVHNFLALGVFALNCIISRHGWIEPFETSQVQH